MTVRGSYWLRTLRGALAVLLAVFIVGAVNILPAHALSDQPEQGITVSPVIIDLNAEKGKVYHLNITVTNVTAGTLNLTSDINDFKAKDETGNPQVLLTPEQGAENFSSRTWISTTEEFTLRSKESRAVPVTITVPSAAEAGGHYSVVRFSGQSSAANAGNVAVNASAGVLVLTRVAGQINEQLQLDSLFVAKNGTQKKVINGSPFSVVARIQNTGNVHVKPIGHLIVKNFFGKPVSTIDFGSANQNVLPGSTRRFEYEIKKPRMFGRYTVSLDASYGTTGKNLTGTTAFWVIPFKAISITLLAVVLLAVLLKRGLKRYHKHILKKAGQTTKRR